MAQIVIYPIKNKIEISQAEEDDFDIFGSKENIASKLVMGVLKIVLRSYLFEQNVDENKLKNDLQNNFDKYFNFKTEVYLKKEDCIFGEIYFEEKGGCLKKIDFNIQLMVYGNGFNLQN